MLTNDWFPEGIVVRGTRTGTIEEIREPYSSESAGRLARTYAALWAEPIEWWGVGHDSGPRNLAMPKQLRSRSQRAGSVPAR
jgi:hypothetical protein